MHRPCIRLISDEKNNTFEGDDSSGDSQKCCSYFLPSTMSFSPSVLLGLFFHFPNSDKPSIRSFHSPSLFTVFHRLCLPVEFQLIAQHFPAQRDSAAKAIFNINLSVRPRRNIQSAYYILSAYWTQATALSPQIRSSSPPPPSVKLLTDPASLEKHFHEQSIIIRAQAVTRKSQSWHANDSPINPRHSDIKLGMSISSTRLYG